MSIFETTVPIDGFVAQAHPENLAEHHALRAPKSPGESSLAAVRQAELRGYGGAYFPVARKWQAAIDAGGRGIVVANGAESEPASSKDASLLQLRPHLVLDGLQAAGSATDSAHAVVWLHRGAAHSRVALERAIAERRSAGYVELPVKIVEGPARYLSGESSAIVRALSGGPALPLTNAVPAAISGVDDRPTVVHNIETLARVGLIGEGVDPTTTRLMTVTSVTGQTVVDAPVDLTLTEVVSPLGGHDSTLLLGGYGGAWQRWDDVAEQTIGALGHQMNAGIVMALPRSTCGIAVTAQIVQYLAAHSARQCGPCLFGLDDLSNVFGRVAGGRARRGDVHRLERVSAAVAGRGACHHPDGAVRLIASALAVFADDFPAHRRRKSCGRRHNISVPGREAA